MSKLQKVFAYIRVSGKGQLEGSGLERQEDSINDYTRRNSMTVVDVYREEGVSGTKEEREALARLIVDLEENGHGVHTVVVEKLDRLSRDLMVQESIIREFKSKEIELISALEGPDLLSDDPSRKLIRHMFGAFAEYEKDMIVLKLKAARDRKRSKGQKCEGRKSLREREPETIDLIRTLRMQMKLPECKRLSCQEIADELNRRGMKTVSGIPFTAKNVSVILSRTREQCI